jgi:hypothetical protein
MPYPCVTFPAINFTWTTLGGTALRSDPSANLLKYGTAMCHLLHFIRRRCVGGINEYLTCHTNWLTAQYDSFLVCLLINGINIEDYKLNGILHRVGW